MEQMKHTDSVNCGPVAKGPHTSLSWAGLAGLAGLGWAGDN